MGKIAVGTRIVLHERFFPVIVSRVVFYDIIKSDKSRVAIWKAVAEVCPEYRRDRGMWTLTIERSGELILVKDREIEELDCKIEIPKELVEPKGPDKKKSFWRRLFP